MLPALAVDSKESAGAPEDGIEITLEAAEDALASILYEEMERVDPGNDPEFVPWAEQREEIKRIFVACASAMIIRGYPIIRKLISRPR